MEEITTLEQIMAEAKHQVEQEMLEKHYQKLLLIWNETSPEIQQELAEIYPDVFPPKRFQQMKDVKEQSKHIMSHYLYPTGSPQ